MPLKTNPRPPAFPAATSRETAQVWTKDNGTLRFWYPAESIVVHAFTGHLDLPFSRIIIERANVKMALASVYCFCDWGDMKSYASESRIALTKWAFASRSKILVSNFCVSSKLILMGITVAGLAVKGVLMKAYSTRAAWERELDSTIAKVAQGEAGG